MVALQICKLSPKHAVKNVYYQRVSQEGKARKEFCFLGSYQQSGLYAQ